MQSQTATPEQGEPVELDKLSVIEAVERLDGALKSANQARAQLEFATTLHAISDRQLQIARATLDYAITRTRVE